MPSSGVPRPTLWWISTSGAKASSAPVSSPEFHRSRAATTTFTFSCDIASRTLRRTARRRNRQQLCDRGGPLYQGGGSKVTLHPKPKGTPTNPSPPPRHARLRDGISQPVLCGHTAPRRSRVPTRGSRPEGPTRPRRRRLMHASTELDLLSQVPGVELGEEVDVEAAGEDGLARLHGTGGGHLVEGD